MHKFNSKNFIYEVLSELELNYCFCVEISWRGEGGETRFQSPPQLQLSNICELFTSTILTYVKCHNQASLFGEGCSQHK